MINYNRECQNPLKLLLKLSSYLLRSLQLLGLAILSCQLLFFSFGNQIFHLLVQLQIYFLVTLFVFSTGAILLCWDKMLGMSLGNDYFAFFLGQVDWLINGINPIIFSLILIGSASFLIDAVDYYKSTVSYPIKAFRDDNQEERR